VSTSIEKIANLRAELSGPPSEDAEPAELALRTGIGVVAPMLGRYLPENPGDLDDMLERGAEWLLSLRSDDAEQLQLAATPLQLSREREAELREVYAQERGPDPDAD
jgi:hypothetical protein